MQIERSLEHEESLEKLDRSKHQALALSLQTHVDILYYTSTKPLAFNGRIVDLLPRMNLQGNAAKKHICNYLFSRSRNAHCTPPESNKFQFNRLLSFSFIRL